MSNRLRKVSDLLCCPDDGERLIYANDLSCSRCGRTFPAIADDFVEVLPKQPTSLPPSVSEDYRHAYLRLFNEPIHDSSRELAWGAEESAAASWMRKRLRQVNALSQLVVDGAAENKSVLCDFAAGAGHYTRAYAQHFRWVLHCDLSASNLAYCREKAKIGNFKNIIFLRIDYFNPPFRNSLDRLICLDTIIRGEEHDQLLLQSIARSMRPDGRAIIDFHNWWHNPLRRVGLLKENFTSNKSYSRKSAETLLNDAGIKRFAYYPFYQECDSNGFWSELYKHLIPPTRLIYSLADSSLVC